MHINLRRYPSVGADRGSIQAAVERELRPAVQSDHWFGAYFAFWDEAGAGVSVSSFADAEAAHRSTGAARRWLANHLDFSPAPGDEFSGECFVSEEARAAAGADDSAPYLLVRLLAGVPATQDTRAFVEQRTLPMIARSPGFRAVWMARSDRDVGGAAVATFFDSPHEAQACHDAAVALLRDDQPPSSGPGGILMGHRLVPPPVLVRGLRKFSGWFSLVGEGPRGQVSQG